ncbi:hypothetical protein, conserved [Plasmodium gonderi]|uniref:Uncharacterized protein n=1 Tax=Plasmodium gonderi TaxID=77519 RepID=A0A1Y1JQM6_PLAGO|nr:hypothetical protein, conserved [Plasmodium gonderi]GAW83828.1 hypothetical protein, conserved [Plasmodium gonderi]
MKKMSITRRNYKSNLTSYKFFSSTKYEKNTKFRGEEFYKYHHEQYVDKVHLRPDLYLKDNEDKHAHDNRLKRNMPFVYSNEVKNLEELKACPLTLVNVKNTNNESFGVATFNPYSLITARVISTNALFPVNINFFIERIKNSLLWRNKIINGEKKVKRYNTTLGIATHTLDDISIEKTKVITKGDDVRMNPSVGIPRAQPNDHASLGIYKNNTNAHCIETDLDSNMCYRLINSEGDNIPGLIIDRYDKYISIQHLTVGMELLSCNINEAIIELLNPKAIIFRNDNKERLNEKLEIYKKVVYGKLPEQVMLTENECFFLINLMNSPNTGWFFNRRNLRNLLSHYAYDKKILDMFSYVGSFGIQCSKMGKAKKVVCVEKDNKFVQLAKESAYLNNLTNGVEFICSDAITFLKNCNELFDIIILDPPNLIPKSKFIESGSKRYIQLINLAQNYITANGLMLIIFTTKLCSYQDHIKIINESFVHTNKTVKIVGQGRASPDNPANLSLYLFADFYWFLLQLSY